ncbi:MAG: hypothetical protein M1823_000635 [Watsoniomyces obsoletus]|nr:MAG: hypothetical protein M1823_000635 [Watsoniomyces obsoletus]
MSTSSPDESGVNIAPIAPPLEFPFPEAKPGPATSSERQEHQKSSAEQNQKHSSRPAPPLASKSMTAPSKNTARPGGGLPKRKTTFWARDGRARSGSGSKTERRHSKTEGGRPMNLSNGRSATHVGPHQGFTFGNEQFQATGKFSKRDGRLGISLHDANTGYLAKALGAGLDRHLGRPEHDAQEKANAASEQPTPGSPRLRPSSQVAEEIQKPLPKLNIVVMVLGSRGDIQPFLRIGQILRDKYGHRVRIATHPAFRQFVENDIGLEFFSVGGDPAELMAFMVKNPGLIPSMETVRSGEIGRRRQQIFQMCQGFWRACINATDDETNPKNRKMMSKSNPFVADVIIANPSCFAHIHCAERLGIPLHLMFTFPQTPTTEFPNPMAKIKKTNIDERYTNFMSYPLVEMIIWQGVGDLINEFRIKTLGLEPVSTLWAPGQLYRQKVPFSYMWSPGLVPKPHDWGPEIDVTGFVFLELASSFKPPEALVKFLDEGPEPIYIGFGSIVVDDPDRFTSIIFEAVVKSGVRALVSKGWGGLGGGDCPDNVYLLDNSPHDWIFPRVSAVIHHGGAGTTAIGLKCGKPTMIVPFFGDQPFWASMIAKAGAGYHEPVPYKRLTVDKLVEGIHELLSPEVKANAEKLRDDIIAEGDGAQNAVDSFHRNLPLTGDHCMRCSILDDRVAVWKVKQTSLRLSALAGSLLVEQRKLTWRHLRLIRHYEWNDFTGPGEPVTGLGGAVVRSVTGVAKGVGAVPVKVVRGIRRRGERDAQRGRTAEKSNGQSSPVRSASSSSTDSDDDSLKERVEDVVPTDGKEENGNVASVNSDKEQNGKKEEDNLAREVARDVGHSLEKSGEALANAPMEISMAIAQGLHNAPRLYGDSTVRRPTRVTGIHSGLRAAGEEFVYGIYDGVTGLVIQPYTGAKQDGLIGFIKGMGRGVGGFVLKDLAAVIGPFGYTLKGIQKELRKHKEATHFIRRSRIQQGRDERQQISTDEEKAVLEMLTQGWNIYLELRHFVNEKKAQGIKGRLALKQEEKRWQAYGAFENVARTKKALQASREEEKNGGAGDRLLSGASPGLNVEESGMKTSMNGQVN